MFYSKSSNNWRGSCKEEEAETLGKIWHFRTSKLKKSQKETLNENSDRRAGRVKEHKALGCSGNTSREAARIEKPSLGTAHVQGWFLRLQSRKVADIAHDMSAHPPDNTAVVVSNASLV